MSFYAKLQGFGYSCFFSHGASSQSDLSGLLPGSYQATKK
jgi:hypothetical protein